jgi:hypothetical protein
MRRAFPSLLLVGALATAGLAAVPSAALPSASGATVADDPVPAAMERLADLVSADRMAGPPASRVLALSAVATARAALAGDAAARRFTAALVRFPRLESPGPGIDRRTAAITAWASTARNLLATDADRRAVAVLRDAVLAARAASLPPAQLRASIDWGLVVSRAVRSWANADGASEALARDGSWSPRSGPGRWAPTPPDFRPAAIPYWGTLRPFVARTATCRVPRPVPYSTARGSRYARDVRVARETARRLTARERAVARFWSDDATGAPTIAATWTAIADRVVTSKGLDTRSAALLEAAVTTAAADAFIVGWRAKYRWDTARPVTVLAGDPSGRKWSPAVTTPASPEYPSAHTTVSWSAARVLEARVGDGGFRVRRGARTRRYDSFGAAAGEVTSARRLGGVSFDATLAVSSRVGRCIGAATAAALPS